MKACRNFYKVFFKAILLLFFSLGAFSQNIIFSEPVKNDTKEISFEVIGKLKGNILVFKNAQSNYAINVYDGDMQLKENRELSFLPAGTFNVDFISFTDSFCLIYQYNKKGVVYCMGVKLDAYAKLLSDPVELDATKIEWLSNSKIYTTINSDDRKKIMLFKIQRKGDQYNFETYLFDSDFRLLRQSRPVLPFDDRLDMLSDFFVDNDGNFVFTKATKGGNRDDINKLSLVTKSIAVDTFEVKNINLNKTYIDEIKLKVDNANKHYLINSFYYDQKRDHIEGLFCNSWDKSGDSNLVNVFIPFNESLRNTARKDVPVKNAFDNFFIRNIIVKKDGGYLLTAEDYSDKTDNNINNPWDRWDYLYGNPYGMTPYNYYNYNPTYNWYYRPYSDLYNQPATRYYYNNVLLLAVDKSGNLDWYNVLQKEQYADNDDNFLSFLTYNVNGQIHFLFNEIQRRNMLLNDNTFTADGSSSRNPPLKTMDNDYQFMPKFGKQVGARQVIIPCIYGNSICFAKIDY